MKLQCILDGIRAVFWDVAGRHSLPEHEVEYFDAVGDIPATMVCYLQCEEGREFRIEVDKMFHWNGPDLKMYLYIDGRRISKRAWPKDHRGKNFDWISEMRNGRVVNANLQFSKLALTHRHEEACHDPEILTGLGEIRIDFAVSEGYPCHCETNPARRKPAKVFGPIHEEVKKGFIGSTVSGGTTARTPKKRNRGQARPHYHIPDAETTYRVIFKYRTREWLMAQRIIGIAPTPKNLGVNRKRKWEDEKENDANDIEFIHANMGADRPVKRPRSEIRFTEDIKPLFFEEVQRNGQGSILRPIDLTLD